MATTRPLYSLRHFLLFACTVCNQIKVAALVGNAKQRFAELRSTLNNIISTDIALYMSLGQIHHLGDQSVVVINSGS
ncbi:hypothetical protein ACFSJY_08620 [Thalassotalea euphylliae]|uniref:hypothetical protein n=1 Tax=Thalassotalea euphylliae TaxID=1655234 RepID=UPI00363EC257